MSNKDIHQTPLEEEESSPLLTNSGTKTDAIIIPPASTNGGQRSPHSRSPAQKSALMKSSLHHHRSVDNQLDYSTEPKPHKQILFRTGSHQPSAAPLSVHYSIDEEQDNNHEAKHQQQQQQQRGRTNELNSSVKVIISSKNE